MQEIHDRPAGDEGITVGDGEVQIESGFDFRTKLNQVEGIPSEVGEKRVVQPHLRRREVEVPRNDGLDACLNGFFQLPSSLPHKCQGNVNGR